MGAETSPPTPWLATVTEYCTPLSSEPIVAVLVSAGTMRVTVRDTAHAPMVATVALRVSAAATPLAYASHTTFEYTVKCSNVAVRSTALGVSANSPTHAVAGSQPATPPEMAASSTTAAAKLGNGMAS